MKPSKNSYTHVQDALQYLCLHSSLRKKDRIYEGEHEMGGSHLIYRFDNTYGASVVNNQIFTAGSPYEVAVLEWYGPDNNDWSITYDTPITSDVERCDNDNINKVLEAISNLPTPEGAMTIEEYEKLKEEKK